MAGSNVMHRDRPPLTTDPLRILRRAATILATLAFLGAAPFAAAERVLVLVDNSGSMQANDADRLVPRAVEDFVAGLPADARVGVIAFDARARLLQPLVPVADFRPAPLDRLDYAGQLTDPSAGVERALYELREDGGGLPGDALVLVTDGVVDLGNPIASARAEEWLLGALLDDLREQGVAVWGIALTEAADTRVLRQLADATGGNYFRAADAGEIRRAIARIGDGIAADRATRVAPAPAAVEPAAAEPADRPAAAAATTPEPSAPAPAAEPRVERVTPTPEPAAPTVITVPAEPASDGSARWWLALALLLAGTGMLGWVSYATWRSGREDPRPEQAALEYFPECYLVDLQGVTDRPTHLLAGKYNMITRLQNPPDDGINYVQIFRRQIGRRHALVEYRDFSFWIIDQNSVNGTFVNGERIHQETRLKHGDRLRFHIYEFEFCVSDLAFSNETLMDRKGAPAT
jgi:uncharacterized protein YegL